MMVVLGSLLASVRLAVRDPQVLGVKVTRKVVLAPAATGLRVLLSSTLNSLAFWPVTAIFFGEPVSFRKPGKEFSMVNETTFVLPGLTKPKS